MPAVDLWQLLKSAAAAEANRPRGDQEQGSEDGVETTVVVLGTKSAGKTTIINTFLDKDENPSATIGLEYSYGRKTRGQSMNIKDIAHLWELGMSEASFTYLICVGGSAVDMKELMLVPVNEGNLHTSVIVLAFDLTAPKRSAEMLNTFLDTFQPYVNGIMESLESRGSKRPRGIRAVAMRRYADTHPDRNSVQPFAIPLMIVGTKYDQFKSIDLDKQRFISKALRWFAHMYGAHLFLTSSKDVVTNNKLKAVLSSMAFRLAPVRLDNITKDYTKPTLVMAGTDSLAEIVDQYDRERDFRTWQQWRTETNRVFSAIAEQDYAETLPDNTTASDRQQLLLQSAALDEPLLDGLMAQKHQETDRMRDEFNQRIRALKESKRAAAAVAAATKA